MGNVIRGPWHHGAASTSSKRKKSLAVTSPSVAAEIFSAMPRDGQPLPSQSCVMRPAETPIDTANSRLPRPLTSRYLDSFMGTAFSSAKTLAQVEILAGLYGHKPESCRQFSMSKKGGPQRKPIESAAIPLQRTFIKQWRTHRELSQTELGDAVGLSTATISQIENAKTGYSQATLEALARALKVHPIDLLVCDPKEHPKGIWQTLAVILA